MDILDKLRDLHKQATTERSHYYVASCCNEAIAEIERLRVVNEMNTALIREQMKTQVALLQAIERDGRI